MQNLPRIKHTSWTNICWIIVENQITKFYISWKGWKLKLRLLWASAKYYATFTGAEDELLLILGLAYLKCYFRSDEYELKNFISEYRVLLFHEIK